MPYKWARQLFPGHYKMFDWFTFQNIFGGFDLWFSFIVVTWLDYFSK